MSEALADVREGFSKKEIKMAIGIASDPRYKGGNYTGAFNAIEKIKKGLAKHPQVAAVLKRQNEEIFEKVKCPDCEGEGCPKCEGKGYMADAVDKEDEPFLKDLIKNLRKGSATHSKQADDLEKAVKEETELDEKKEPFAVVDTADGDKVVGTASDEKGAKSIITSAELPPMKIKDKKTLKIVKVKKKQMIGHPIKEEVELDESKMKDLSMKIDSITAKMKKDKQMKSFADKFKKDAMKSMDIKKSLEKVLPDYIAGKDITALVKEALITLFTPKLDEGTWAVPETPAQKRDLKKLLSKPLPLGKEGENASDKMYSIIGDDELFDDLYSAGKESPDSDARPIIKKAMKRLKIREDSWDSWRLEESTKPDHIKVFNSLKRGDKVEINYDSAIAGGTTKTFVIKTKNKVYKGKVDKVTMYPDGKTGGVKFHLYQYDNRPGVYMAIGDMGASLRDIKKI